jgi:hypothetical protein
MRGSQQEAVQGQARGSKRGRKEAGKRQARSRPEAVQGQVMRQARGRRNTCRREAGMRQARDSRRMNGGQRMRQGAGKGRQGARGVKNIITLNASLQSIVKYFFNILQTLLEHVITLPLSLIYPFARQKFGFLST